MQDIEPKQRDVESFAQSIRELVTEGSIARACKNLIDFANEFVGDKSLVNGAIQIMSLHEKYRSERHTFMNESEKYALHDKLVARLLSHIDTCEEEAVKLAKLEVKKKQERIEQKTEQDAVQESQPFERKVKSVDSKKNKQKVKNTTDKQKAKVVVSCSGISKKYDNFLLQKLDLSLKSGDIAGVVGQNGSGKTTLLKMVANLVKPSSGLISYPSLKSYDNYSLKQQIAYIPQRLQEWEGNIKVNLHFFLSSIGVRGQENEDAVNRIVDRFDLREYLNMPWEDLSGGYQMRFEVARLLLARPRIIILDEPLANLDINAQVVFLQDLKDHIYAVKHMSPISVLITSQHLDEIENIANKLIFLDDGKALFNDDKDKLGLLRKENSFEVKLNISKSDLYDVLDIEDVKVERWGNYFIIDTPLTISSGEVLQRFVEKNVSVLHFKDISFSTRKLFHTK